MAGSLILFDIDGTLVRRAGPHHRLALIDAIRRVTGAETTTDGVPVHGMLDPDILNIMLERAGLDNRLMPEIIETAQDIYEATVPDLRGKTCPGVHDLLETLRSRGDILALVTGNLTRIGWRKLERAGVRDYFRFGAFAEMAPTRSELARLAIGQARREALIGARARICLVGDAPQDIIAAKDNGIRSIGVRTGVTPQGELEACSPDHLLDDLTQFDLSIL